MIYLFLCKFISGFIMKDCLKILCFTKLSHQYPTVTTDIDQAFPSVPTFTTDIGHQAFPSVPHCYNWQIKLSHQYPTFTTGIGHQAFPSVPHCYRQVKRSCSALLKLSRYSGSLHSFYPVNHSVVGMLKWCIWNVLTKLESYTFC